MISRRTKVRGAIFIALLFLFIAIANRIKPFSHQSVSKDLLAQALEDSGFVEEFPKEIDLLLDQKVTRVQLQYSFDSPLQEYMENLFHSYQPDYGAFVALDPVTGRILSLVSYTLRSPHVSEEKENLALKASFPSASVFKIVTAAAAIAEKNFTANTVIPFNGSNHTLFRSNILKTNLTRWTRYMTLKDAFAKSVNTVFGKIGVYSVGSENLRHYADRFGFNRKISSDMPLQVGKAPIPENSWELAETASGFTPDNTMSPLQGALIASAVVNNGVMMEPYIVQSVISATQPIYFAEPKIASLSVDSTTAGEIRSLMRETIRKGTSQRSFRGFFRGNFSSIDVGGKTGSLTGKNPAGKYDWFIGYAEKDHKPIALAVLTVHKKFWKVKSSYLARRAIERYYIETQSH